MNRTNIEWVKNPDSSQGYSLNPIKGKCPMACPYCYARAMYDRFKWNPEPRFLEEVLDAAEMELIARKHPMGIFMCSTFEWLWNLGWAQKIFDFCKAWEVCPDVRFYLLTHQPQNLIEFSPFPDNCWVGVTVTNKDDFWRAFQGLGQIEAKVKYLSFEPLLGSIWDGIDATLIVDWVIIGAQTNPYTPPKLEWVEEIVRACDKAGVPVFLKNNLVGAVPFFRRPFCQETMGEDGIKIVGLRQEMPSES